MNRTNDKTLKEAMAQLLNVYRLKGKFDETNVIAAWQDIMGVAVANRTKEIFIKDKKLFVRIESSVIKNQLVMMRSQIIENLNQKSGTVVVTEIIFL
ncbi:MAG: DUF721 domain-containing protein [Sphingobacteriales bacterium]|nr:MAG: DUF721 domain-containing protein [Sphingobacteriales bacterium]